MLEWLIPLSFICGFITSIAGGGGILFVTSALALGISPVNALALNRLSDIGVICGSINNYRRVENIPYKLLIYIIPIMLVGAIIGAQFVVNIPEVMLQIVIIIAAILAITFTLYNPQSKDIFTNKNHIFGYVCIALIGFWEGAVAMAGATFFMLAAHHFFHLDYLKARALQMFAGVPETLVSAYILTLHSTVTLKFGLVTYLASAAGAYLGSKIALKRGQTFIRLGMVVVSLLMLMKVLYDLYPYISKALALN